MRRVVLACLALLLVLPATAAAEQVPYRMDASNQHPVDELPTNGGANDTHTVYIGRKGPDGTCAVYPDDIGHEQPSIAVDGDGYIHAFVSMHGGNWIYHRSSAPGDVTTMVNRSAELPDQGDQYTYPTSATAAAR